jgi:NADH-quinone oxidoreductase subunit M
MTTVPYLSLAIWAPILAGLWVLALGGDRKAEVQRRLALAGAVIGLLVTLPLYFGFNPASGGMQFVELTPWIARFNINYHLGVDGISMLFVLLNSFITVLVVIAGWTLIPMFIIIGVWGGPNRVYAALKFFLYTLAGSLLMLVALLYLYDKSGGSFSILDWHKLPLALGVQKLLFFGFLLAFAVKVPMWPVHTWLPDAHVEAPTGGSVVLAAIMLKLGAYGFVRFTLPIAPDASRELAWLMIALSLIAVVYIGLVALVQTDMKKLIAYSSISHMGFVTLGFFLFNALGVEGGLVQMISHGFVSAAMFLCVGVMYDRMHTRMIADYGGVVNTMPRFASLMMLFAMANSGLPATSGFVGEFMVIMGAMKAQFWLAFAAASTLIWGAAYTLWMYKRVIFGAVANEHVAKLSDLNRRELAVLGLLAVAVLAMGIYPLPFTEVMHASVNELLRHVALPKL